MNVSSSKEEGFVLGTAWPLQYTIILKLTTQKDTKKSWKENHIVNINNAKDYRRKWIFCDKLSRIVQLNL